MACDEKRGYKGELGTRKLFTLVILDNVIELYQAWLITQQ